MLVGSCGGHIILRTSSEVFIFNLGLHFEGLFWERCILKGQIMFEGHWKLQSYTLLTTNPLTCLHVGNTLCEIHRYFEMSVSNHEWCNAWGDFPQRDLIWPMKLKKISNPRFPTQVLKRQACMTLHNSLVAYHGTMYHMRIIFLKFQGSPFMRSI